MRTNAVKYSLHLFVSLPRCDQPLLSLFSSLLLSARHSTSSLSFFSILIAFLCFQASEYGNILYSLTCTFSLSLSLSLCVLDLLVAYHWEITAKGNFCRNFSVSQPQVFVVFKSFFFPSTFNYCFVFVFSLKLKTSFL